MQVLLNYLGIALGSALGGVSRYALARLVDGPGGGSFPWGTLAVNVSGCFLIGLLAAGGSASGRPWLGAGARLLLMAGFCGGFTTFSAFSLQTLELFRAGATLAGLQNLALSLGLCLGATWAGLAAGGLLPAR